MNPRNLRHAEPHAARERRALIQFGLALAALALVLRVGPAVVAWALSLPPGTWGALSCAAGLTLAALFCYSCCIVAGRGGE